MKCLLFHYSALINGLAISIFAALAVWRIFIGYYCWRWSIKKKINCERDTSDNNRNSFFANGYRRSCHIRVFAISPTRVIRCEQQQRRKVMWQFAVGIDFVFYAGKSVMLLFAITHGSRIIRRIWWHISLRSSPLCNIVESFCNYILEEQLPANIQKCVYFPCRVSIYADSRE